MEQSFKNKDGKMILSKMVKGIQENKDFLGDVDGLIGDGDHGMNMNKGFTLFETRFQESDFTFSEGLNELGMILMNEIGGSMGPIYGTVFMEMSAYIEEGKMSDISLSDFSACLSSGLNGLQEIVDARVGDKTLIDTLSPAAETLKEDALSGKLFKEALGHMDKAAMDGRDSTKNLAAKYGRSSRLGERSRGVLDAGSCSCYVILHAMTEAIGDLLE